jgi:predicted amidohydrolase
MPHSAPTPTKAVGVADADLAEYDDAIRTTARNMAVALGVPTVMANKVGPWRTKPPWPFPTESSRFPGLSAIARANGELAGQLGDEEGVLVAKVVLGAAGRKNVPELPTGKWVRRPPKLFRLFVFSETLGGASYRLFRKRPQR